MDDRVPGYLGRLLTADREPAGTCFQVDPGVLVTACHVLDDLDAARPDAEVLVDPLAGGDPRPARVLRVDPIHDLAVLRVDEPLPASVAGLAPSDEVRARTDAQVLGVALVDDAEHEYRYAPAVGEWLGPTVRDEEVPLAVFSSRNVARGMSGGPVRRMTDDVVVGVVSGRYNTTDGWLRDTVWLARVENLLPLLDGLEFTRSTLSWDRGYSLARVAAQAFEECGGDFAVVSDLSRGRVRWEALLDGEPLTFAHAVGEAVVPRRVRHGGHEYAAAELGELLGANTGRTLYLYGDAGDGKSSFLSQLAKQLLDTHVF
ncbi:MAG TPA: serine protease, partial [Actinophytocola sp.]|nr:serine protease [Actinophytocola sp.]